MKTNKIHLTGALVLLAHKSYRSQLTPIVSTEGQVVQHCLLTKLDETYKQNNKQTPKTSNKKPKYLSVPE